MNRCLRTFAAGALLGMAGWAQAQGAGAQWPEPRNVVQLSASATVEVAQDWLTLSLGTSREGPDAGAVQAQLRQALDDALGMARQQAQDGQLEVRSGNFRLVPRYSREGRITGWQGSVEMVLEGRDVARIAALAGRISSLTMAGVQFGLSRAAQSRVEVEAQAMAIDRFKSKAGEIARGFGFSGYTVREVSVHANDQGTLPRPRAVAMAARSALPDAPVPVEAGKAAVVVTVSGSVQLK